MSHFFGLQLFILFILIFAFYAISDVFSSWLSSQPHEYVQSFAWILCSHSICSSRPKALHLSHIDGVYCIPCYIIITLIVCCQFEHLYASDA